MRLGAEAAARLAAIRDTAELQTADQVFVAAHPPVSGCVRGPTVRRMQALIARYRGEFGIDRLIFQLELADAPARCLAPLPCNPRANPA